MSEPAPSREVPPRRARFPRYTRFLATGVVVGILASLVLVLARGDALDRPAVVFGYLGVLLAGLGALVGGLVAVLAERRSR